jgi:hypothetical protein
MFTSAMLIEAEQALHALQIGKRIVSISKDGRQVQYSQATISELRFYIDEIRTALGLPSRRLPPAGVRL